VPGDPGDGFWPVHGRRYDGGKRHGRQPDAILGPLEKQLGQLTRITGDPAPARSNAMVVPSFDCTLLMVVLQL